MIKVSTYRRALKAQIEDDRTFREWLDSLGRTDNDESIRLRSSHDAVSDERHESFLALFYEACPEQPPNKNITPNGFEMFTRLKESLEAQSMRARGVTDEP